MSQRYIILKMASYKELQDEGYASYTSTNDGVRLRRRSSASLPSNRSSRAPSLRHNRARSVAATSTNGCDSPVVRISPSSTTSSLGIAGRDSLFSLSHPTTSFESPETAEFYFPTDATKHDLRYEDEAFEDPTQYRLSKEIMFVVACLVVLVTSGGLILGFGPVYSTLVAEEQWSELCTATDLKSPSARTCASQEIRLQYVFSTGFLCLSAANAFFGVFLDVAGPRLTALVGLAMSTIGNFALAYGDSHQGTGAWIIIGYSLIGAGGMGSYLAAFQVLQLFEVQGFVCSALSSLFNCSGYVYMLLQVDGITRAGFFHTYGIIVLTFMILAMLVFPTNNIVRPKDTLAIPMLRIEAPAWMNPLGLFEGMREELKRSDLWFFAVFFGWISLIFGFAGGAIPSILTTLADDDPSTASTYINILYPVIVNGTFIYSPLVGHVIDHYGFKIIFVVCLVLVQGFIALLLVPSLHAQILTFLVYAMAQACLYALQFAYIMMCFPPELYGTLQAFMATVSFIFGLLNYALNPWTQVYLHGKYTLAMLALGVPTIALYYFIDVVRGCEDKTVPFDPATKHHTFSIDEEPHEQSRLLR